MAQCLWCTRGSVPDRVKFLGHMSHSGDLLLQVGVRRALKSSSQKLLGQSQPSLVCSNCRVRWQEIVNFMTPTPRGGNLGVKNLKLMYFFKTFLLYSGAWFILTKCIVMMIKEGSTKVVNFMTPGGGVLFARAWPLSHIVKMHYFF